jgi:hypothetical protein
VKLVIFVFVNLCQPEINQILAPRFESTQTSKFKELDSVPAQRVAVPPPPPFNFFAGLVE